MDRFGIGSNLGCGMVEMWTRECRWTSMVFVCGGTTDRPSLSPRHQDVECRNPRENFFITFKNLRFTDFGRVGPETFLGTFVYSSGLRIQSSRCTVQTWTTDRRVEFT